MLFAPASNIQVPFMQPQFGRGRRISTPFSPLDIAGCALWLVASNIEGISQGDPVPEWPDASPAGRDATQSEEIMQPTFQPGQAHDLPAVRFTSPNHMNCTDLAAPASVFLVAKTYSGENNYPPFVIGGFGRVCARLDTEEWGTYNGGNLSAGETLDSELYQLLEMTTETGALFIYRRGVEKATSSSASTGGGSMQISGESANSRYLTCDMAEMLIYDSVLSTGDRQLVENYLISKYAL